jgi:hypothetical protein
VQKEFSTERPLTPAVVVDKFNLGWTVKYLLRCGWRRGAAEGGRLGGGQWVAKVGQRTHLGTCRMAWERPGLNWAAAAASNLLPLPAG